MATLPERGAVVSVAGAMLTFVRTGYVVTDGTMSVRHS